MHISRLTLRPGVDPRRVAAMARADSYGDHKALWKLFDDNNGGRPFLFRRRLDRGLPSFLVVSSELPLDRDGLWNVESKPYRPQLRSGQRLAFSLRANPVVSRRNEKDRQVRHDVVMDARAHFKEENLPRDEWPPLADVVKQACTAWLSDRAPRLGFELAGQGAICDGYRQHRLPRRGAHPVRFSSVDFEGSLQVVDTDLFLTALYQGIGHAKAFGCGLLLVRSVV